MFFYTSYCGFASHFEYMNMNSSPSLSIELLCCESRTIVPWVSHVPMFQRLSTMRSTFQSYLHSFVLAIIRSAFEVFYYGIKKCR